MAKRFGSARGQSAVELFLVLAIFLTVFVWTGGYASSLEHLKEQTGTIESQAILRTTFNHAVAAYTDGTNITAGLPCLTVAGEGYAYNVKTNGLTLSLYSALLSENGGHVELDCSTTYCPTLHPPTSLFVAACTNHTNGYACFDGLSASNSVTISSGACT